LKGNAENHESSCALHDQALAALMNKATAKVKRFLESKAMSLQIYPLRLKPIPLEAAETF